MKQGKIRGFFFATVISGIIAFSFFSCSNQLGEYDSSFAESGSGTAEGYEASDKTIEDEGKRGFNPDLTSWTLMFYLGGDNSLDSMLLENMSQLLKGYCGGMRAVVLIDRSASSNSVQPFGQAFTTSRMYTINQNSERQNSFERIYGNEFFPELAEAKGDCELDTADAHILKNFIHYCKEQFPASHYGLIIGSHGGGVRTGNQNARAVVQDAQSDNDWIFTAELTDVLTEEESIDVLAFDACCMGSLELAYQFCGIKAFGADYIVASPAEEWSRGWNYYQLASLFAEETPEPYDFAIGLVKNYQNYVEANTNDGLQTLTCLRASAIPRVKEKLDLLAKALPFYRSEVEAIRGKGRLKQAEVLHYFNSVNTSYWLQYPYFDLYSLSSRLADSNSLPEELRRLALELAAAVDEAVIASYAGSAYSLARSDVSGLSIFFPNGKERHGITGKTYWDYQYWYNALPASNINSKCYGKLAFCGDGAAADNGVVENWFELLDYWFDNDRNVNGYTP